MIVQDPEFRDIERAHRGFRESGPTEGSSIGEVSHRGPIEGHNRESREGSLIADNTHLLNVRKTSLMTTLQRYH